jgi:Fe-Mn family superoxide dismutase
MLAGRPQRNLLPTAAFRFPFETTEATLFTLPDLPYPYEALGPTISAETLHFHHDKHHAAYVKTTNELLGQSAEADESLESVIAGARQAGKTKLFNNAAQAWNHAFYWQSMSPERQRPGGELDEGIRSAFGDLGGLRNAFVTEGAGQFGSGWVWLAADQNRGLKVLSTHDAANPLADNQLTPLLVCDVWEHAYYIDHRNDRKAYLEGWFDSLPNWDFAGSQLRAVGGGSKGWEYPRPTRAPQPA